MLKYECQLYLQYDLLIIPLVVLSDDHPIWHPTQFELTAANNVALRYNFGSVKLLHWKRRENDLINSDNPYEILIAIRLNSRPNTKNYNIRLQETIDLFGYLVHRNWQQEDCTIDPLISKKVLKQGIHAGIQQGLRAGIDQAKTREY